MVRVTAVRSVALACLALAACNAPTAAWRTIPAGPGHAVRVSAGDEPRASLAVAEAVPLLHEWLGPPPASVDPLTTVVPSRVVRAPRTMDVESAVVFALARRWWPPVADADRWLVDGAAWYLQSRIVAQLFERAFMIDAHSADRVSLFGGYWTRTFDWLPLDRWSAGLGRGLAPSDDARVRGAHVFATLERLLTWPRLQAALQVWAQAPPPVTRASAALVLGNAVGQDLDWLLGAGVPDEAFDYAAVAMTSVPGDACTTMPCYRTELIVERRAPGRFTGSSRPPLGSFPAGDAVEVEVRFEDGAVALSRWDGRSAARTFAFESQSPARSAAVDPKGLIVIDENHLNNRLSSDAVSARGLGTWLSHWFIWLQGVVLLATV